MTYKNFDTGEIWTEEEIREEYDAEESLKESYKTFEDYLEYLLDLGRQKIGGIVEIEGMKLHEYTNKQYVILETAYDASVIDATYEEDDYNISQTGIMKSSELNDTVNGLIDPPEDNVEVWRGTVTSASGTEDVTIYIPESWD